MADDFPTELTLPLKRPVRSGDKEITSLVLREPTALDLEQADGDFGLLARISGVDAVSLGKLAVSDLVKANEYVSHFSRLGQLIGADAPLSPNAVPETYELTLVKPLQNGEETIESLTLQEPSARQSQNSSLNWVTNNLLILAAIAQVPIGILRRMSARDFAQASDYLSFFVRPGQLIASGLLPISVASTAGDQGTAGA